MRSLLLAILACFSLVGCAHVDRAEALAANRYDVMTDVEIARAAVREALGELHRVEGVDASTGAVTRGEPAFRSREERLSYEARVDRLIRARTYGQGPTLQLVRIRCDALQRTGWQGWPGDALKQRRACEYGDGAHSVHTLYKQPMLQRAWVEVMLDVIGDQSLSHEVRRKLDAVQRLGVEPYFFVVEAWETVEGFRPRG